MRTIPDVRCETKIRIKNIQLFSPSVNYDKYIVYVYPKSILNIKHYMYIV